MTIQQLRILGFLAEYKSITKAADYCFLSQSALTRQIRSMETELGFPLFIRHFSGVELTAAGQEFYKSTRTILSDYDAAVTRGRKMNTTPVRTSLRIGVYGYSLSFISALCKYCEKHLPHITFHFISCRTKDSEKYLSDNLLDLCFPAEYSENSPGICHEPLLRTKNTCLVPKGHPYYGKKQIKLDALSGHALLLLPAGQAKNADRLRAAINETCTDVQLIDYQTPVEADALMLSKHYILMTLGFFEVKKDIIPAALTGFPDVTLSALYREEDENFIKPVLTVMREYINQAQNLGPFISKL